VAAEFQMRRVMLGEVEPDFDVAEVAAC